MVEFCLDCWNRINKTNDPPQKYVISKEPELCEECSTYKAVILSLRRSYPLYVALWMWRSLFGRNQPCSTPAGTGRQMEEEHAQK